MRSGVRIEAERYRRRQWYLCNSLGVSAEVGRIAVVKWDLMLEAVHCPEGCFHSVRESVAAELEKRLTDCDERKAIQWEHRVQGRQGSQEVAVVGDCPVEEPSAEADS